MMAEHINWTLGLKFDQWPWAWSWILKVKHGIWYILWQKDLICYKIKNEYIDWTHGLKCILQLSAYLLAHFPKQACWFILQYTFLLKAKLMWSWHYWSTENKKSYLGIYSFIAGDWFTHFCKFFQRLILSKEISCTSIEYRAWIFNDIHIKLWIVITYLYLRFDRSLAKFPLKVGLAYRRNFIL